MVGEKNEQDENTHCTGSVLETWREESKREGRTPLTFNDPLCTVPVQITASTLCEYMVAIVLFLASAMIVSVLKLAGRDDDDNDDDYDDVI